MIWVTATSGPPTLRTKSATSGVVLVAADEALAIEVKELFARHAVTKLYNALVFGRPRAASETWRDRIGIERGGSFVRAGAGHVPAQSEMRVLEATGGQPALALIELRPLTGRTHQLRVQCSKRRLPIVGDRLYGGRLLLLSTFKLDFRLKHGREERPLIRTTALHAEHLRFVHPVAQTEVMIAAPWPKDLAVAVKYLRRYAPSDGTLGSDRATG